MRLTADVLLRAECLMNPTKERELNLRGFKIPLIENLAVLQDQVDVMDLSDNDLRVLENFPRMPRLTTILLTSNAINRINASQNLSTNLPNLTALVATNNKIASFTEIYNLAVFKKLEVLSLMDNPISMLQHYRNYVIYKIPSLKLLDFVKVKRVERENVAKWSKSKEGRAFIAQVQADAITVNAAAASVTASSTSSSSGSTIGPMSSAAAVGTGTGGGSGHSGAAAPSLSSFTAAGAAAKAPPVKRVYTEDERRQIREAVEAAATPAEMDAIEKQLKSGTFKFATSKPIVTTSSSSSATSSSMNSTTSKRKASEVQNDETDDSTANGGGGAKAKAVRLNGNSQ